MDSSSFRPDLIPIRKDSSPPCTAGRCHELHRSLHSRTAEPDRPPRPAAARFAHFGHGSVQFSLPLLHAQGTVPRALSIPEITGAIVVRGDRAPVAAVREPWRAKTPLTGGEPLLRTNLADLVGDLSD